MDKKTGMILGGVGLLIILVLFILSGNSTRDMIIGKWYTRDRDVVEFHDNGTVNEYRIKDGKLKQRENKDRWSLSDDEKTLIVMSAHGKDMSFNIISIDANVFCLSQLPMPGDPNGPDDQEDIPFCFPKYKE